MHVMDVIYLLNHEVYSEYDPEVESFVLPRIFA